MLDIRNSIYSFFDLSRNPLPNEVEMQPLTLMQKGEINSTEAVGRVYEMHLPHLERNVPISEQLDQINEMQEAHEVCSAGFCSSQDLVADLSFLFRVGLGNFPQFQNSAVVPFLRTTLLLSGITGAINAHHAWKRFEVARKIGDENGMTIEKKELVGSVSIAIGGPVLGVSSVLDLIGRGSNVDASSLIGKLTFATEIVGSVFFIGGFLLKGFSMGDKLVELNNFSKEHQKSLAKGDVGLVEYFEALFKTDPNTIESDAYQLQKEGSLALAHYFESLTKEIKNENMGDFTDISQEKWERFIKFVLASQFPDLLPEQREEAVCLFLEDMGRALRADREDCRKLMQLSRMFGYEFVEKIYEDLYPANQTSLFERLKSEDINEKTEALDILKSVSEKLAVKLKEGRIAKDAVIVTSVILVLLFIAAMISPPGLVATAIAILMFILCIGLLSVDVKGFLTSLKDGTAKSREMNFLHISTALSLLFLGASGLVISFFSIGIIPSVVLGMFGVIWLIINVLGYTTLSVRAERAALKALCLDEVGKEEKKEKEKERVIKALAQFQKLFLHLEKLDKMLEERDLNMANNELAGEAL